MGGGEADGEFCDSRHEQWRHFQEELPAVRLGIWRHQNHSRPAFPSVSMITLQHWVSAFVGTTSAQRGLEYFRDGHATVESATTHQGSAPEEVTQMIRGQVRGSLPTPYQVWASLNGDTITDAHCSCPMGTKGSCKHVAALLLAAKAPPEQHVHILSAPASTNGASFASPSRQLYAGRFSATLPPQTSPVSLFRSTNSPKKGIWGYSHSASTTTSPGFSSVQPGFSLKEGAHVNGPRDPFDLSQPHTSSPQKGKHLVFHPLSVSQVESEASTANKSTQDTQRGAPSDPESSTETQKSSSPEHSSPTVPAVPHSTPVQPSQDSQLQDELNSQRGYTAVLEKECEILREKVRFLQTELARKSNEIFHLKSMQETSKRTEKMDVDHKPIANALHSEDSVSGPTTVAALEPHIFEPSHLQLPHPKPSEILKDSIEDMDAPPSSPYKKRSRDFTSEETEEQPGFTKRFSLGVSTTQGPDHISTAPTAPGAASPPAELGTSPAPHVSFADTPSESSTAPSMCRVDSQALLDAMDVFEGTIVDSQLPKSSESNTDTTPAQDVLNLSLSTSAPPATPPVPQGPVHLAAPHNSLNSSGEEDSNTTGGSKPSSPSSPLPSVSTLVTQQSDHSPSFMVLSQ